MGDAKEKRGKNLLVVAGKLDLSLLATISSQNS